MSNEERIAYLEETLRKAPEGSARRIWAAAQLAELRGHGETETRGRGDTGTRGHGDRGHGERRG